MRRGTLAATILLALALTACGGDDAKTADDRTADDRTADDRTAEDRAGATSPAATAEASESPEDEPRGGARAGGPDFDPDAVAAAVVEYRQSAGACDGQVGETYDDFDHDVLETDGMMVVAVLCDQFAYQWLWDLRGWDGAALVGLDVEQWRAGTVERTSIVLGYPHLDDDGVLVNLEKARGPGDCGLWQRWFVGSTTRLGLAEAREQACDDGAEYVEPDQWPMVHPGGD